MTTTKTEQARARTQTFNSLFREWKRVSVPQGKLFALIKSPVIDQALKPLLRAEWHRLQAISEPLRLATCAASKSEAQWKAENP